MARVLSFSRRPAPPASSSHPRTVPAALVAQRRANPPLDSAAKLARLRTLQPDEADTVDDLISDLLDAASGTQLARKESSRHPIHAALEELEALRPAGVTVLHKLAVDLLNDTRGLYGDDPEAA